MHLTPRWAMLLIAITAIIVYANSLGGDFVMDDVPTIAENPRITSATYIPDYFSHSVWFNTSMEVENNLIYRPLHLCAIFLEHLLWEKRPMGYHLFSLGLHIVNSLLVFFLLRRFAAKGLFIPWLGAMVFAVHPAHSESVAWISGVTDLMVTFFILASFLCYLSNSRGPRSLFSLMFFTCALLTKEVAITYPLLLLAYQLSSDKKIALGKLVPFIALTVLYFTLRSAVLGSSMPAPAFSLPGFQLLIEFVAAYVQLLLIPWPLNYYFDIPPEGIAHAWTLWFAAIIAATTLWMLRQSASRPRLAIFAVCWFAITLLPALPSAFFHQPIFAIRTLYLPSIGLSLFLLWLLESHPPRKQAIGAWLVGATIIVFSVVTMAANRDWDNNGAFYSKAIRTTPTYSGAYIGMANHYVQAGQADKAIEPYLNAVKYGRRDEPVLAYTALGTIYGQKGDVANSNRHFRAALELNPGDKLRSAALTGMGNNAWTTADYRGAAQFYERAIAANSRNHEAILNIIMAYERLGEYGKAARYRTMAGDMAASAR
ncbi:MAG: tetratricopeptide repeat protein [Mariprofundaceae bacterium]